MESLKKFLKFIAIAFVVQGAIGAAIPGLITYALAAQRFSPAATPHMYVLPQALETAAEDASLSALEFRHVKLRSPWGPPVQKGEEGDQAMFHFDNGRRLVVLAPKEAQKLELPDPRLRWALGKLVGEDTLASQYLFESRTFAADPANAQPLMWPTKASQLLMFLMLKSMVVHPSIQSIKTFERPTGHGVALLIPEKKLIDLRFYGEANRTVSVLMIGKDQMPTEDEAASIAASMQLQL